MKARDVMVSPVVTVKPSNSVQDVAKVLLERRISAVPVVDDKGKLVGIISEMDFLHRSETGTERRRPWWLGAFVSEENFAVDYIKSHGQKVADIMTRRVITATPDTPLHEVASLLEKHSIKRVPIMENGQLVGIVSRANLVQAVASAGKALEMPVDDSALRDKVLAKLRTQPFAHTGLLNVTVNGGVVDLWGMTNSEVEKQAVRVAIETTPGVRAVVDNLITRPVQFGA